MKANDEIVVCHDYFAIRGGGERLVLTLANALNARLLHGYRTADTYDFSAFPKKERDLGLPVCMRRTGVRAAALAALFAKQRYWTRNFPIRIFSGVAAPFSAPRCAGGMNLFYCHTPPRFLFDQRGKFLDSRPFPYRVAAEIFEHFYREAVSRMDVIVANSENVRRRIRKYLSRESVVIHPPVDTDRFLWRGQEDYYLSTARLSRLKRVERIVDAFLKMPDKKLVVASGGEEFEKLKRKAAGAKNITFLGWVDDDVLAELIGKAVATIYIPEDEDFGMSPVESMAAGKPVIGVADGGLKETILPGITGILLQPDFSETELLDAIGRLDRQQAKQMRPECEQRASEFSRERFISNMRKLIQDK